MPEMMHGCFLTMACKIDHTYYYMHIDEEMPEELQHEFEVLIKKRAERVPLQYITGEQEFMGMTFHVNSNVLIPRQDTETLVEEALKVVKPGMKVLDMCTGSGCVLISIFEKMYTVPGDMDMIFPNRRSMLQRKMQN